MNREGMNEVRRSEEEGNEAGEAHRGPGDGGLLVTGSLGWCICESFVRGLDCLSSVGG